MHRVPFANMANADICGQCHSRYSNSTVAYENYDGSSALRQYTIGTFNPLGLPTTTPAWSPSPITDFLNIPTPTADTSVTPPVNDFQQMIYYRDAKGELLPWSARGHEEGAQQYNEWAAVYQKDGATHIEAHANALDGLIAAMGGRLPFLTSCLECHSADYRLTQEWNAENPTDPKTLPTIANAKYGVTCQACHDPHTPGEQTSVWNEERNPQLTAPRQELCVECHNAELGEGGVATPGSAVHHPMKEMMDGTGAIGVHAGLGERAQGRVRPVPHGRRPDYDRNAVPMTGANHVFAIVEPEVAMEARTTANIAGRGQAHAEARPAARVTPRTGDPYASYLQDTLDNRQAQMRTWDAEVGDELDPRRRPSRLCGHCRRLGARRGQRGHQREGAGRLERERARLPERLHQPAVHRVRRQLGHPQLGLRQDSDPQGPRAGEVGPGRARRARSGSGPAGTTSSAAGP